MDFTAASSTSCGHRGFPFSTGKMLLSTHLPHGQEVLSAVGLWSHFLNCGRYGLLILLHILFGAFSDTPNLLHAQQVLLPGESHGWRNLVGYSPWGLKELNTTERLHLLT